MKKTIFLLALFIASMTACNNEPTSNFKPLDLMSYGVPLTILTPDSVKVTTDNLIVLQEISIKGNDDYFVQIRHSDADTGDLTVIKAEELADAKNDPFFSEIIKEDEDGFIFKTQLDSNRASYGFRYFKLLGDKEYRFRNGIFGIFTQEATEQMYESVRSSK